MELFEFRVWKYRNIEDSGPIKVNSVTAFVGQNEAGKSNLFDALYRVNPFVEEDEYNIDEDWPVDDWGSQDTDAKVCEAKFHLSPTEILSLWQASHPFFASEVDNAEETQSSTEPTVPEEAIVNASKYYDQDRLIDLDSEGSGELDVDKRDKWIENNLPKLR